MLGEIIMENYNLKECGMPKSISKSDKSDLTTNQLTMILNTSGISPGLASTPVISPIELYSPHPHSSSMFHLCTTAPSADNIKIYDPLLPLHAKIIS